MLANRKRRRHADLDQDTDTEDSEEQPLPKRGSLNWLSSKLGGLAGKLYRVMKKWVGMPPDPPEDIDSGEPISESCSLDGPVGLLSLQDDSVPQRTPHTSVEGEQHPNEQFQSQPYRHHFTQRDSSTPKLMVGSHRATVLDNTPTRHTTMTPLFNEIEKQHFSSQYFCVLSTWAERKTAKKNDEDPRRKETASIHTVLRESVHHRTPVQRVEKTPSPSSSPAIQLWSSSCPSSGGEERRDNRRRKEHSDVRGKLPDSVEKTVNNTAPKDHTPWWSKSARTTRPFYPSIRTGQYDHLQTMFHYLKKDMMDDRKDFEAQRTALEKIVTLAREERERFVDDSAKRVLRGDEGETEMSLELSPQQENTVREVWNYGNEDDSYSTAFSIVIKRCDLHTLPPSTWLNDAVINFYFNLIAQRSQGKDSPCRAHCMRTFFYPKLLDAGYSGVRRWTKKVDIFKDFDIVLIPVHLGVHWTLAVVDLKRKQVVYYDSLLGDNRVCLTALLDWLVQEAKDKKGMQYNVSDWKRLTPKDIPRQQNSSDCGVFTCMFARYYTKNEPFSFKQDDMPQIRKKMVCEIIEKRLF